MIAMIAAPIAARAVPTPPMRTPRKKLARELSLREVLDRKVSEWELQANIINRAMQTGWLWHHTPDSMANRKAPRGVAEPCAGLPDLFLCRPPLGGRPGRLLFLEVKTETGRLREKQRTWLAALLACGVEARVARPSDWSSGQVEEWLR